ncbi:hypothetical protein PENSPDRAFT_681713 [Peniophora sp. CONT]|nr:hypothetical protein PENSPDRAFT_681713 [Peniophora sp. CONT]
MTLVFVGIGIYDYASSIAFDWTIMTRPKSQQSVQARAVKWVYIACRYLNLATCITFGVLNSSHGALHCTVLFKILNVTTVSGVVCATILLFIRVGVVWRWDKRITAVFTFACLTTVVLGLRSVIKGLIYCSLIVILEIPMVVFWFLDYNEYMNMYFTTVDVILLCDTAISFDGKISRKASYVHIRVDSPPDLAAT